MQQKLKLFAPSSYREGMAQNVNYTSKKNNVFI